MRISTEMAKAINDQISYEASSANAYIAIGSWCERIGPLSIKKGMIGSHKHLVHRVRM